MCNRSGRPSLPTNPTWHASRSPAAEPRAEAYADNGRLLAEFRTHWQALAAFTGGIAASEIDGSVARRPLARLCREVRMLADSGRPVSSPWPPGRGWRRLGFPGAPTWTDSGLSSAAPIRPARPDTLARIDALARLPLTDLRSYLKLLIVERLAEYVGCAFSTRRCDFTTRSSTRKHTRRSTLPSACSYLVSRDFSPSILEAATWPACRPPRRAYARAVRFAPRPLRSDDRRRNLAGRSNPPERRREGESHRASIRARPRSGTGRLRPETGLAPRRGLADGAHKTEVYLAQIGAPGQRKFQPELNAAGVYSILVNNVWLSAEYARDPWIQRRPFSATNFGSLGALLGHEIAHSFGIQARAFDDAGVKHETWSKQAVAAYEARTLCLETQLGTFDVGARWKVDAHRTLDEDLAELVGVRSPSRRWRRKPARRTSRRETTGAGSSSSPTRSSSAAGTSGHPLHKSPHESYSPPRGILNGILANVPEFAETFHCAPGTRMAPRERCAIW